MLAIAIKQHCAILTDSQVALLLHVERADELVAANVLTIVSQLNDERIHAVGVNVCFLLTVHTELGQFDRANA